MLQGRHARGALRDLPRAPAAGRRRPTGCGSSSGSRSAPAAGRFRAVAAPGPGRLAQVAQRRSPLRRAPARARRWARARPTAWRSSTAGTTRTASVLRRARRALAGVQAAGPAAQPARHPRRWPARERHRPLRGGRGQPRPRARPLPPPSPLSVDGDVVDTPSFGGARAGRDPAGVRERPGLHPLGEGAGRSRPTWWPRATSATTRASCPCPLQSGPSLRLIAVSASNGQLEAPRDLPVGGQAVLEGVMMRGVSTWAVAVRKPTPEQLEAGELDPQEGAKGEIDVVSFPLVSYAKEHRWARLPVLRGVVALVESLKIGFRALNISANAQMPPDDEGENAGDRRRHLGRHRDLRDGVRHRPLLPAAGGPHQPHRPAQRLRVRADREARAAHRSSSPTSC